MAEQVPGYSSREPPPPTYNPLPHPSYILGVHNEAPDDDLEHANTWLRDRANHVSPPVILSQETASSIAEFGFKVWSLVDPPDKNYMQKRFRGDIDPAPNGTYGTSKVVTRRGCKDVSLLSNFPLHFAAYNNTRLNGIYFEITIEKMRGIVAIGMVPWPFPQFRLPGWERGIGLHLDDMHVFLEDNRGGAELADPAPLTSSIRDDELRGEMFGCGVDYRTQSVFFTHNGRRLEDHFPATARFMPHDLFAAIGVCDKDGVNWSLSSEVNAFTINFGGAPFKWNEANVGHWCRRPQGSFELDTGDECPPEYSGGPALVDEKVGGKGWTPE